EEADDATLALVAENYAHEFMMLGYTSKKVLSLFTSPHFKSANTVYNILGQEKINEIIARVFGQAYQKP
ncbi:MAG: peptidylprolyl isomerase, partial [Nitrospinaceae bacterium]|nr:peptidylprolyl isomerase [Nitrospinaceae bacterium]NIR55724.1 peptidylprolyl isomerase [Nitrospinaceae bacterium]NIS86164.1 peptidylprolyl isomerase [Nitrospinaceae bacterium]NIT83000.1 peptidylprolyl isomerase [Nitrospinaceae bacterium]NIU45212.1 peptidylprolyl isomerase [Nitrospinaceae bacterium]